MCISFIYSWGTLAYLPCILFSFCCVKTFVVVSCGLVLLSPCLLNLNSSFLPQSNLVTWDVTLWSTLKEELRWRSLCWISWAFLTLLSLCEMIWTVSHSLLEGTACSCGRRLGRLQSFPPVDHQHFVNQIRGSDYFKQTNKQTNKNIYLSKRVATLDTHSGSNQNCALERTKKGTNHKG